MFFRYKLRHLFQVDLVVFIRKSNISCLSTVWRQKIDDCDILDGDYYVVLLSFPSSNSGHKPVALYCRKMIRKNIQFFRSNVNELSFFWQESLKVLRLLDDKIIYRLNKSVPTTSFAGEVNAENKCKELYTEVGHKLRY